MTLYLAMTLYDADSVLQRSDQIMVPSDVWERLDRDHDGSGPIFVEIGGTGLVGRLRPAIPADALTHDSCRIPEWMRVRLGLPEFGEEWIGIDVCQIPAAGTIVLRARTEATLTGAADPVAMLTAALSGSAAGGELSWACLCAGSELPLACGIFDVMEVRSIEDFPVPAACVLDVDVNLELVPALDHVPPAVALPPAVVLPPVAAPAVVLPPVPAPRRHTTGMPRGFIPFSGSGQRLGSS